MRRTAELGLATGLSILGLTACSSKHETYHKTPKPLKLTHQVHSAAPAADVSLSGCDFRHARVRLRQVVSDNKSFTAEVASNDGRPAIFGFTVGRETIINPIILMCKAKPVAMAGLYKAYKTAQNKTYDPVRIYRLHKDEQELIEHSSNTMETTSMQYVPDHEAAKISQAAKHSGFTVIAELKGFKGSDGLIYGLMGPTEDAQALLQMQLNGINQPNATATQTVPSSAS